MTLFSRCAPLSLGGEDRRPGLILEETADFFAGHPSKLVRLNLGISNFPSLLSHHHARMLKKKCCRMVATRASESVLEFVSEHSSGKRAHDSVINLCNPGDPSDPQGCCAIVIFCNLVIKK